MALFSPIELHKKKANLTTISWSDDRNEMPQQSWGLRGLQLWPQTASHAKKKMASLFLFFFLEWNGRKRGWHLKKKRAKEGSFNWVIKTSPVLKMVIF